MTNLWTPLLFTSVLTCPYEHLRWEKYFLYGCSDPLIIFFYLNEPSVVLGKFQIPALECNLEVLEKKKVHLVRRFSGGGCVYHDLGNLNISVISQKNILEKNQLLYFIKEFFAELNVDVEVTERGDLLHEEKKFTGSAYRETKDRSLHHFTLLVNANLSQVSELLFTHGSQAWWRSKIVAKATQSRPKPVSNVIDFCPVIATPHSFMGRMHHFLEKKWQKKILMEAIEQPAPVIHVSTLELDFASRDYIWGSSPSFHLSFESSSGARLELYVESSRVVSFQKFSANETDPYICVDPTWSNVVSQCREFSIFDQDLQKFIWGEVINS
jgi:lipoate-protein ligase A